MAGLALVVGILVPSRFELVPAPTSHLSNATSLQSEVHAEQFLRSTVGDATQAALAPGNPLGLEALLEAALDLDSPLATRPDAPRNGFTAPCKSPTWRERLKRTIKVGVKRACIRGAEALADRLAAGKAHGQ